VYPHSASVRSAILVKANGQNHAGFEYGLWLETNAKVILSLDDGASELQLSSASSYVVNKWQHVAGVYDSSTQKMYVYLNGKLDGVTDYTLGPRNSNTVIAQIGSMGAAYYFMDGLIDDVRAYNRALAPAEIQQLYSAGR
jgi:Concanavalin A-like lectin/glucanases superfamily